MSDYFDTHDRFISYTNLADITPRYFIPKTKLKKSIISRFNENEMSCISFDPKTGIFVCHGFKNKCTRDDCMNLILHFHLMPMGYPNGKDKIKKRMVYFIRPEKVIKFTDKDYRSFVVPDDIKSVMKSFEYDNLRVVSGKSIKLKKGETVWKHNNNK